MNKQECQKIFNLKKREYNVNEKYFIVEKIENLPKKSLYRFTKRLFDLVFSLVGLVFLIIPMIIISILIKVDSKGPIFYRQERLGKNFKKFYIIKFRSMRTDAEKKGPQWADKNDNRVTKFGNFLRKSRLDELPQLINILLGQMSFVGPRPEREVFYDEFRTYIEGFDQRLLIIQGLTGLAQINGGYDLLPEEKIIYDIEYIKRRSLWLDIKLIIKTVLVVFSHNGAR
ncbi:MAG: sugar transferase [Sphaerochaetaceae bacterium]|nr:sugar transferase [Sphaerochaetaceae bacterium]